MRTRKIYDGGQKKDKKTKKSKKISKETKIAKAKKNKIAKAQARCFLNKMQAQSGRIQIGVLTAPKKYNPYFHKSTKELEKEMEKGVEKSIDFSSAGESFLDPEYVKWLDLGGATVVPIHYNLPVPILRLLLTELNGFVMPGGALETLDTHVPEHLYHVIRACQTVVNYSKIQTDLGRMFPVWGTCQGFELLAAIATWKEVRHTRIKKMIEKSKNKVTEEDIAKYVAQDDEIASKTESEDLSKYLTKMIREGSQFDNTVSKQSDPLFFNNKGKNSIRDLFTKEERKQMEEEPVTVMYHNLGFDVGTPTYNNMMKKIEPMAWAYDHSDNKKYLSIMKYKEFPIYGVAFHPEKGIGSLDPRRKKSIKQRDNLSSGLGDYLSSKLAVFFVGLAKQSPNTWLGPPTNYLRQDKFNLNMN